MAVINPEQKKGLKTVEIYRENINIHLNFDFAGMQGLSLELVRGESEKEVLEKLRRFASQMMNNKAVI